MSIYFKQGSTHTCVECGFTFEEQDMIHLADKWVCANCKPIFVQRMREGVALPGTMYYAGFWIRFGAKIVDIIIQYILLIAFSYAVGLLLGLADLTGMAIYTITNLLGIFVGATYTTYFLGKHGATPGKMAFKLMVVTSEGDRVSYARAFGRHFAEILSGMIFSIGYIIAAFDEEKRTLHDRICNTRVIQR